MAERRTSVPSVIATVLFSLPFVAVGLGLIAGGVSGLWQGRIAAGVFGMLCGVIFGGAGVRLVLQSVRGRRSVEALSAGGAASDRGGAEERALTTGYRAGPPLALREAYVDELEGPSTLPVVPVRRGAELAVELGVGAITTQKELWFVVLWNALMWPVFVLSLRQATLGALLFLAIFPLVGGFFAFRLLRRWLSRRRLPVVEIEAEPARLGAPLRVHLVQRGPARIVRLDARVVCTEHVVFMDGTIERRESHEVYSAPLADEVGLSLRAGDQWTKLGVVELPAEPCSFAATHNRVEWAVLVKAEIDGWPDYDETFVFRAVPQPGGAP